MEDTDLFASISRACAPGTHVLLTGDIGQLPPVGSGAPLRDLRSSGVLGVGELTEIQRNAGDIVLALKAIREKRPAKPSPYIDLANGHNWKHFECGSSTSQIMRLSALLAALPADIDPIWDIQVICALNEKGDLSKDALNGLVQGLLNPRATILKRGKNEFKVGDKVMGVKNTLMGVAENWPEFCEPDEDDPSAVPVDDEFVANGELGEVIGLSACGKYLGIKLRMSGKIVVTKIAGKGGGSGDSESTSGESPGFPWQLAYAVTFHKSQGSQFRITICVIDEAARMIASCELWTTGLSRAEELLITVGKLNTLHRQCRVEAMSKRKTFLCEKLKGEMATA